MKKTLLALIFLALLSDLATAQSGPSATWRFLNNPVSAQSSALGGFPVSLMSADPAQMHLNPAFLSEDNSRMVSASFSRFLTEVDMALLSGTWHLNDIGTLGFGIRFVDYGDFDRIDVGGQDLGTYSANDMAIKLAFSRKHREVLQYGIGVDFIHSSYESFRASGIAFSGGILVDLPDRETSFGLTFLNAGWQLSAFDGVEEKLPFDLRAGVTHKLQHLPLRLSVTAHSLTRWDLPVAGDEEPPGFSTNLLRHLTLGGEFLFSDNFHLRLGYNKFRNDDLRTDGTIDFAGFGFGVGLRIKSIGIDISRNSYSETGSLLQLGISTRF